MKNAVVQKNAGRKEKPGIRGYSDAMNDGAILYLSGIDGNLKLYIDGRLFSLDQYCLFKIIQLRVLFFSFFVLKL